MVYRLCQPDDRLCQIVEMDKKISYHAVDGFFCKTACHAINYFDINFQFCQKIPNSATGIAGWGGVSVMIKYHTGIRPEAQPENHLFFVIRKIEDGFFCKTVCHAINYLYKWLKGMQIWTKGEIFVKVE